MSDLESHADNVSTYNPDGLNLFKNRKSATKKKSRPNTSKSILSTGSRVSHTSQVSFASEVEAQKSKDASTVSTELIEEDLSEDVQSSVTRDSLSLKKDNDSQIMDIESEAGVDLSDSGQEADVDTDSDYTEVFDDVQRNQEGVHKQFAQLLAERLSEAALMAGAKDNITVMVMLFPGCGLDIT